MNLLSQFFNAWTAHDGDALAALMADDAVYESRGWGQAYPARRSADAITAMSSISSDFTVDLLASLQQGTNYAAEWEMTGTQDGPVEQPPIPPSGRTFRIQGGLFLTTDGSRITGVRVYWNLADLVDQLGVRLRPAAD